MILPYLLIEIQLPAPSSFRRKSRGTQNITALTRPKITIQFLNEKRRYGTSSKTTMLLT
ncbi:MAG: hypothetical protein RL427_1066 [Bacteroidota bacterium]|jgi:hypothetical protein